LKPLLKNRAELVDVADAVARQVARLHPAPGNKNVQLRLLATTNSKNLLAALPRLELDWLLPRVTQSAKNVVV
jgi:glutamate racemase